MSPRLRHEYVAKCYRLALRWSVALHSPDGYGTHFGRWIHPHVVMNSHVHARSTPNEAARRRSRAQRFAKGTLGPAAAPPIAPRVMAHPGGKMRVNKRAPTVKFLQRLVDSGKALTEAQQRAVAQYGLVKAGQGAPAATTRCGVTTTAPRVQAPTAQPRAAVPAVTPLQAAAARPTAQRAQKPKAAAKSTPGQAATGAGKVRDVAAPVRVRCWAGATACFGWPGAPRTDLLRAYVIHVYRRTGHKLAPSLSSPTAWTRPAQTRPRQPRQLCQAQHRRRHERKRRAN